MSRSRFERQPFSGIRLTERDEELVVDLYLHRAMSRLQIQNLYFNSLSRVNMRLRQLYDHGYLMRHYLPLARYGSLAIYTPGPSAIPIIAVRTETEPTEVRRHCRSDRGPVYLEHGLAIVDFRLALKRAVSHYSTVRLVEWLPECKCRHEFEIRRLGGGSWRIEVFKPDAYFRLLANDGPKDYFAEIDLGNTSHAEFLKKIKIHKRYLTAGLFEPRYGNTSFRTLILTTSKSRQDNLLAIIADVDPDLFRVFTFSDWRESIPLDCI
jgi:hypothetical protein